MPSIHINRFLRSLYWIEVALSELGRSKFMVYTPGSCATDYAASGRLSIWSQETISLWKSRDIYWLTWSWRMARPRGGVL